MYYTFEDVKYHSVGDIFVLRGKKYKLLKKTSTAIAVSRWYWWNSAVDMLWRKLGSRTN